MATLIGTIRNVIAHFRGKPRDSLASGTSPRIDLSEGDACLVIAKAGKVLYHTPDLALSHAEFVKRAMGTLEKGAWVGTIRKCDGEIVALSSRTFYGNQLPPSPDIMEAIRGQFR